MNHFSSIKTPESVQKYAKNLRNNAEFGGMAIKCETTDSGIEVLLYGVIGDSYDGNDAATFAKTLGANPEAAVTLRINSPGGFAFDGLAIHNVLRDHKGATTAIVESLAASAASLIAMGADTVHMQSNAIFHVHQSLTMAYGHQAEMAETLSWLQTLDESLAMTYADKTGIKMDEMRAILLGENGDGTKYSADAALKAGFVDKVLSSTKKTTKPKNETDSRAKAWGHKMNLLKRR